MQQIVNSGKDPSWLPIGTQIRDTWTDYSNGETKYNRPWDVVHYNKNGMYLKWHYAMANAMIYDAPEAIYYVGEEGLAAGTYYISIGYQINSGWATSKHIQFTLSEPCVPGDQFVINVSSITDDPTNNKTLSVYTYGSSTPKQTTTTSNGTTGTELGSTNGTRSYMPNGNVNSPYSASCGNPRWGQSAARQWLNSDMPAGEWWTPQNPWDRPPAYAATLPGFLSGITPALKNILQPVKVVSAQIQYDSSTYNITYDKVFLPSVEQTYTLRTSSIFEDDEAWDYYKQIADTYNNGAHLPTNNATINNLRKIYKSDADNASAVAVWMRTVAASVGTNVWYLKNDGSVGSQLPTDTSIYFCPCICIAKTTPFYLASMNDLDWTHIKTLASLGQNSSLAIGTQIQDTWYKTNSTSYTIPWDIIHYDENSMYIQAHYDLPDYYEFDAREALYSVGEDGLPAGTYYISIGQTYSSWNASKHIQFTLENACDPGDQITLYNPAGSKDPTNAQTIYVYGFGSTTAKQTVITSNGTEGIELGTISPSDLTSVNGNVNSVERIVSGCNIWSQSAIRQWLNSDKAAGAWWTPQNPWDRPPSYASSMRGFLCGLSDSLRDALATTTVKTASNTGVQTITQDKIYIASIQELYTVPDVHDVEGEPWDYYKQAALQAGAYSYLSQSSSSTIRIKYRIGATTTGTRTWLRSCTQSLNTGSIKMLSNTGAISATSPYNSYYVCPVARISLVS